MGRVYNTSQFIELSNKVHHNKYYYTNSIYVNTVTPVEIICPEHGVFYQTPSNHLQGQGCPICGRKKARVSCVKKEKVFIDESQLLYGDKYDYSKVKYLNNKTKVCVICNKHGEFWITPNHHLRGIGCPICGGTKRLNTELFNIKSKEIHSNKYDYSKVKYINNRTKVCIICPEHGEFWQRPSSHLQGQGCPYCRCKRLEEEMAKCLNEKGVKFQREKTFDWLVYKGHQYLDFFLPEYNIAIECQGIQHFEPTDFAGRGEEWAMDEYKNDMMRDDNKKRLCKKYGIRLVYVNYDDNVEVSVNNILNLL